MKTIRTLLFIFSIIVILCLGWYFFPAEGLAIGGRTLRFPSYAEDISNATKPTVDVDRVLNTVDKSFEMTCSDNILDSMRFFRSYLKENPNRIYLPDNDYTYFDTLFLQLEQAQRQGKTFRIMHYGDSQIEMDRISSVLRQKLQEFFGGSGPSMIPAIQPVGTISVSQNADNLDRYTIIGNNLRAPHNRYGVMAQFGQVVGSGSIKFVKTSNSNAFEKAKEITKVSVLLGRTSKGFTAALRCDGKSYKTKTLPAKKSVSLITWELPTEVAKGTLTFKGNAEIYAVLLDGKPGVAVDNVPLRGCSGTIFTRINEEVMRQSFDLLDTRLIIMQFGGNYMASIKSTKVISKYMTDLERQIRYLHRVAPEARILFIGPSDMGRTTKLFLPELNDSLRVMSQRNHVAYWDMFNVMGGKGSMAQWVKHNPPLAGPDHIHFTFRGAQEIGTYLTRSFTTYYDFYKLRKHVPSDKVIEFINLDAAEDSIRTARRIKLPVYNNPYSNRIIR